MTRESAPRFTRESLVLGTVILPVRKDKDDAQRLKRQSGLKSATHVKCTTMPNASIDTAPVEYNVDQFGSSTETVVDVEKPSPKIPSVRIEDVDGTIQTIDKVDVGLPKRDGPGKKKTVSLAHVRKLTKDFAAKLKLRSRQVKPTMSVIQEKVSDPVLTEKLAVEKNQSGLDPRPAGAPLKRPKSIWGHFLGFRS